MFWEGLQGKRFSGKAKLSIVTTMQCFLFHEGEDKLSHLFCLQLQKIPVVCTAGSEQMAELWVDGVEPKLLTVYHFGF